MILLIVGLSGSGKTTLATCLAARLGAIHLNGDAIRADLSSDLTFAPADRVEQARRIGAMSRLVSCQGFHVVADFICPTHETRTAFGRCDMMVWVNRVSSSRFNDTDALWENPDADVTIEAGMTLDAEVQTIINALGKQ